MSFSFSISRLDADTKMIREMEKEELKARAVSRCLDKVVMTDEAKALFNAFRDRIKADFPEVIETAEAKSVSYHDPDFFLEVDPAQARPRALDRDRLQRGGRARRDGAGHGELQFRDERLPSGRSPNQLA